MKTSTLFAQLILVFVFLGLSAQQDTLRLTDSNAPLHAMQPAYEIHYGVMPVEDITNILTKIFNYLEASTPAKVINRVTGEEIKKLKDPVKEAVLARGDYRLTSYEWGVTYAGMINVAEATGDNKYREYVAGRLGFLAEIFPYFKEYEVKFPEERNPLHQVINPLALDDAGAMCAAMIKAQRAGINNNLKPLIDNYIDWISNKQFRLEDGSLARNRPQPNTIWLDDLFMSVPALAQMGKLTGDIKYYDDAVKQVLKYSERMFNWQNGLYMHGWVKSMDYHPAFYWARANGWAVMTMVELLDVLPENHSGREPVMKLLNAHIQGLSKCQSGKGFWHQLLDREDSYLETSATAIYTYAMAKAINKGWIDAVTYGPTVLLAWNAVSTKVKENGQVEGTCVGTGMAFDPAFYYYRPVNVYAAHSYGPVLLAGSEVIKLIKNSKIEMNDSSVQFYK